MNPGKNAKQKAKLLKFWNKKIWTGQAKIWNSVSMVRKMRSILKLRNMIVCRVYEIRMVNLAVLIIMLVVSTCQYLFTHQIAKGLLLRMLGCWIVRCAGFFVRGATFQNRNFSSRRVRIISSWEVGEIKKKNSERRAFSIVSATSHSKFKDKTWK